MKKILCALICLVLVASVFTACGETENTTTTAGSTTTTQATTTTTTATTTKAPTALDLLEVGYWYFANPDEIPEDQRVFNNSGVLHIKSIEGNVVTFDLVERELWDLKDVQVTFDGNEGKGMVDGNEITMCVGKRYDEHIANSEEYKIEIQYFYVMGDGEKSYISTFYKYRSDTPVVEELKYEPTQNYDLASYKGMWFQTEDEMNIWKDSTWVYGYLDIKNVDGNKVTFSYSYVMLCGDVDIVVEVNNNVGVFMTEWSFGVIRFDENGIRLMVSDIHYGQYVMEREANFIYHADYSEKL